MGQPMPMGDAVVSITADTTKLEEAADRAVARLGEVQDAMHVRPGIATTEYQVTRRANWLAVLSLVLSLSIPALANVVGNLPPEAKTAAAILGGVVAVLGIVQKVLADLGYIKSRTAVKQAVEETKRLAMTWPQPPDQPG